jgi:branched-chain amino acid transport system substrate-binding protein
MRKKALSAVVAGMAIATSITACSSSKKNTPSTGGATSGGSSAAAGGTIKLGVISDLTGAYSSGFLTTEKGIKAYVEGLNAEGGINGQKITYVMADTASSPPGALTAAQKLVQTDKVFAIIEVSAVYSGAEPYLLKQGIPVLGGAFDGPEWA